MKEERENHGGLDMEFGEALRRFIGTKPNEVAESIEAEKKAREKTRAQANKKSPPR